MKKKEGTMTSPGLASIYTLCVLRNTLVGPVEWKFPRGVGIYWKTLIYLIETVKYEMNVYLFIWKI